MSKTTIGVAAAALAVAAGTHIAAFDEHLAESTAAAVFFAIVAVLQIVAALVVLRGTNPRVRNAIVIGNVALIALWAWSRTTGLQIGPDAGPPEAIGLLDTAAVLAQLVAVVATVRLTASRRITGLLRPQLALVAIALAVGLAGVRLQPAEHAGHTDAPVAAHHHM